VWNHPRDRTAGDWNEATELDREDLLRPLAESVPLGCEDFLRDWPIEPEADLPGSSEDDGLKVVEAGVVDRETEPEVSAGIAKSELGRGEADLIVFPGERTTPCWNDDRLGAASSLVPPDRRRREILDCEIDQPLQGS
jgi:hypothetical protein